MSKKSGLAPDDLEKGLKTLEEVAATPRNPRTAELFAKAQGGTITSEERDELVKSLATGNLSSKATEALEASDTIKKSLDVSDFLKENHRGLVAGLTVLADTIEKSDANEHQFRVALAKSVIQIGEQVMEQGQLVKSLVERLDKTPARPPKSVTPPQPLQKSFAGVTDGDTLSKSQIVDAMSDMIEKGNRMVAGEDMLHAATKYEATALISPEMLTAVREHITKSSKAA